MVGLNISKNLGPFQGWSEERKRFFHQYGYDRGPGVIPPGQGAVIRQPKMQAKRTITTTTNGDGTEKRVIQDTEDLDVARQRETPTFEIDQFTRAGMGGFTGGAQRYDMAADPNWSAATAANTPRPLHGEPIGQRMGEDAMTFQDYPFSLGGLLASPESLAPGVQFDEYAPSKELFSERRGEGGMSDFDEIGMQRYWQQAAQREQEQQAEPSLDKIMDAIMMAESKGDPNAHNTDGEDSIGLFQINWDFWGKTTPIQEGFPVPYDILNNKLKPILGRDLEKADLFDPMINRQAAYAIQESEGFSPWSVYKSGKYLDFLPEGEGGTMADPRARVAGPLIDRPTGIHPDVMTPPYWAGERFPEDAPYPVPTGQDDPTGAPYGGRFETGSSDYEIQGMLSDAIRSGEAIDRIGRPTFERDQFTTAGMGGFTGGSSLFDMPSDPTWSDDAAINVPQTDTEDKSLLGKVGSAAQDIVSAVPPWAYDAGEFSSIVRDKVLEIKEKIPPDLLERAVKGALQAGISVDEYLAEKVGQIITKGTEIKGKAEPVFEQIGEKATEIKEEYYDPIDEWLEGLGLGGSIPPVSEWKQKIEDWEHLPHWGDEVIEGVEKVVEGGRNIWEGKTVGGRPYAPDWMLSPIEEHVEDFGRFLTETQPERDARLAQEKQPSMQAEYEGLLQLTPPDSTPAEVAGEEAGLLAVEAFEALEDDGQGIAASAETGDAPLITPEEVGETTGRSLNESVNRIWANFPQDIEGKRERYLQALGELYKKIAILNVISALTGAPSMAPQLMELASKKFEALEGFEGEERLQDIAKGVYFTEDGRFDPPASQRDAFERAIAFGGTMEEAKTISGYMPEGEEGAKVKQYYRDKMDGTWEVFRSSVDPGPGYIEGKPAGDPPSAGGEGGADDALTKRIKKFQEHIAAANKARELGNTQQQEYHMAIANIYKRHLDKEGTKESRSDLFNRLYAYYWDANKGMANTLKSGAPTFEKWLLEDEQGMFHAEQHLGPNYTLEIQGHPENISEEENKKPVRVTSQAEYDALKPLTLYEDDEGIKMKGKK